MMEVQALLSIDLDPRSKAASLLLFTPSADEYSFSFSFLREMGAGKARVESSRAVSLKDNRVFPFLLDFTLLFVQAHNA